MSKIDLQEELNAELDTVYRKGTLGMNRFSQISYLLEESA
jgi:hypothetical protein